MVEERGFAAAETAAGDGGGIEEGFGEDWSGGEFVFGFLRVVKDEDSGGGWDGFCGKRVTETYWIWSPAVGADGTTVSLRRGWDWEVMSFAFFSFGVHVAQANGDSLG